MTLPHDLNPVTENAIEAAVIQHEHRIQDLEKDKPVHEALGNYQDVSRILIASIEHLATVMSNPEAYIAMYLNVFQRLPRQVQIDQAWQVIELHKASNWNLLGQFTFHALRCHGGKDLVTFWRSHAPFHKDASQSQLRDLCTADIGLLSLNLAAPSMTANSSE